MSEIQITMIVLATHVELARTIAYSLSSRAAGMFVAGLSATGNDPATHYVSSGWIAQQFVTVVSNANIMFAACQSVGLSTTLEECQDLVTSSVVSAEDPFLIFDQLGLKPIPEEQE